MFLNLLWSVLQVWSVVPVREGARAWLVQRMFLFVGLRREEEKKFHSQHLVYLVNWLTAMAAHCV